MLGVGAGLGVPIFFVMQVSNWPSNCKLDCHDTSAFPCPEFAPATGPSVLLHTYSHLLHNKQEERDKERLEEIRELNRATLKATGEQMSEEEITDLRPSRYLDRREFKDDD